MSIEALVDKYIGSTEKTLKEMKRAKTSVKLDEKNIDEILAYAMAYLEDAKYYRDQKKLETSLTSIAYCEGLIDALKLMGAIKIPSSPQDQK
jgi:FAD synthetase